MAVENDKIEYGGDLMLFVDGKPIAFSTDAKLSIKLKTRDVSSKDSGAWTSKRGGKLDWGGSASALYSDDLSVNTANTYEMLYDKMILRAPIDAIWAVATGDPHAQTPHLTKTKYSGKILITSLDPSAPDGETASFSMTCEGDGILAKG